MGAIDDPSISFKYRPPTGQYQSVSSLCPQHFWGDISSFYWQISVEITHFNAILVQLQFFYRQLKFLVNNSEDETIQLQLKNMVTFWRYIIQT